MHTHNKHGIKGQWGTWKPPKHLVTPCGEGIKKVCMSSNRAGAPEKLKDTEGESPEGPLL